MGKTILSTSRSVQNTGTISSGTTVNFWLGTSILDDDSTEANRQVTWRSPTTLSRLYVRVTANSINSGNTTLFVRNNGVNTTLTVSISAGSVGEFEDTTNSASVVAGDRLNYRLITSGTSGSITISVISVLSDSTTNH